MVRNVAEHRKKRIKSCDYCGKDMIVYPYQLKQYKHTFCSKLCRGKHHTENPNLYGNKGAKLTKFTCEACGEIFYKGSNFPKSQKYCSRKCMGSAYTGNKHHNWIEGKERFDRKYMVEYREWRQEVYKRDKWKCVICGSNEKINSHHMNSWNISKEDRFDVDNGVCLCQDHHIQFHRQYGYGNNTKAQFDDFMEMIFNDS